MMWGDAAWYYVENVAEWNHVYREEHGRLNQPE